MTTRIAAAILGLLFAAAAGAQTTTLVAPRGDSEQRTTMPDYCSERDVNCVLYDGPPRQAVVGAFINRHPGTTPMAPGAGTGATVGGAAGGAVSGGSSGTARR